MSLSRQLPETDMVLRMQRDGNNRDLAGLWAVTPEYKVITERAILHVGLEDLRVCNVRVLDRVVFVCFQSRMTRVFLEQFNTL